MQVSEQSATVSMLLVLSSAASKIRILALNNGFQLMVIYNDAWWQNLGLDPKPGTLNLFEPFRSPRQIFLRLVS